MSSTIDPIFSRGFGGSLKGLVIDHPKKEVNRIKPDYQKNLEEQGWKFIGNVKAKNKFIDYTQTTEDFKCFREYYERSFPGKRIGLFKAYYDYGGEIPPEKGIVAIYTQKRE